MVTGILLCEEDDLLKYEPNLDQVWPRLGKDGARHRDWNVQITLASQEVERRLRNHKTTPEYFVLGQLGLRSREFLKDACAMLALQLIFIAADRMGDQTGYFARKAAHYLEQGNNFFTAETIQLDYDTDNSGTLDDSESAQPMPARFIRG